MKREGKILLIFTMLLIGSCRQPHAPPNFTLCIALEEKGVKNCVDNAIPELKNGKDMQIVPGDIVMPAESFRAMMNWGTDLRKDLISCENKK